MSGIVSHFQRMMQFQVIVPAVWTVVTLISALKVSGCRRYYDYPTSGKTMENGGLSLFNFTVAGQDYLDDWYESSDTAREVGKSKGAFVMQITQVFRRAVFFALLNPQPNGACFVGFKTKTDLDLSGYSYIVLRLRAQGDLKRFKVVLTQRNEDRDPLPAYESMFEAPRGEMAEVRLALSDFKAYVRGKLQPDAGPLDKGDITTFGLQAFGGVYEAEKQSGVGSLEIDWIAASN